MEPPIYDLAAYGAMIADRHRVDAYREALAAVVTPGCTVLDIGSGVGIFALLALELGAGRVHAVEPTAAIQVARDIARDNGLDARIEFHQCMSWDVTLEEPADVVISDLRGVLPLFRRHLPTIIDARERLLAPEGALIPRRDKLWAALISAAEEHDAVVGPWARRPGGCDLRAARELAVNRWCRARFRAEQVASRPVCWATLDYVEIDGPDVRASLRTGVETPTECHGLALWFDTELTSDVGFSGAPGAPEVMYAQAFYPWPEPVELETNDVVEVSLRADLIHDDYIWRWRTRIEGSRAPLPIVFEQSSFHGLALSAASLQRGQADYAPSLSAAGAIERDILILIDGDRSLRQIAREIATRHPDAHADENDALAHVVRVARLGGG